MIDNLVRDLKLLWKADTLIARVWADGIARRIGFLAFAALIAAFGLGMANIAGFYALQPPVGPVWAGAIVAMADFALSLGILLVAGHSGSGREIELAFKVREMAFDALQADTRDLKAGVDGLALEMRNAKQVVVGLAHNPLDVAAQKLLIPAALSIIKGLRARKQDA